jgi:hypothetical protein
MYKMIAYNKRPNHYKFMSVPPTFQSIASDGINPINTDGNNMMIG